MGNLAGVAGGGSLPEQIGFFGASTVAGTVPAAGTPLFAPVSVSATFQTGGIRHLGCNVAMANIQCGAVTGSGLFTVKVQHSNDDGVTDTYTDLASSTQGDISGSAVATGTGAIGASANTDTGLTTDLRQAKLWIRYYVTKNSGTSAILAGSLILGSSDALPVTN
jgi:hypothetical protein